MLWLILAVVLLSLVLLTIAFRSLVISVKAAILNLLSVGAAYGVVVAVFQWGWGSQFIGIDQDLPIPAFVPMLMFAIVFGLSMDYEVFLLSRVREAWHQTGDAHRAVAIGIGSTARVITTAAAIMVVVFSSFVLDTDPTIKMLAVGMAVAVLIDASVVRMVLVPALMSILGRSAWWLPSWLDRIIPDLQLEGPIEPVAAEEPEDTRTRAAGAAVVTRRGRRAAAVLSAALTVALLGGCTGSGSDDPAAPASDAADALHLAPDCPSPPADHPTATVDALNKLVASIDLPAWQAGDIGASARLSDGRLVWLFGDTVRPELQPPIVANSMLVTSGTCIAQLLDAKNGPVIPDVSASVVRWPMSVAVGREDGHDVVMVLCSRIDRGDTGAYGFTFLGTSAAVFTVEPGEAPQLQKVVDLTPDSRNQQQVNWGSAATRARRLVLRLRHPAHGTAARLRSRAVRRPRAGRRPGSTEGLAVLGREALAARRTAGGSRAAQPRWGVPGPVDRPGGQGVRRGVQAGRGHQRLRLQVDGAEPLGTVDAGRGAEGSGRLRHRQPQVRAAGASGDPARLR